MDNFVREITEFCDENKPYIAKILLNSDVVQTPTWKVLKRYWSYAKPAEIEYSTCSFINEFVLFSFSVASGQGGIHALWNTHKRRWEQVSEADYVACALFDPIINSIVSLHYIAYWGSAGHHSIWITPITRVRNGGDSGKAFAIETSYNKGTFNPSEYEIVQSAFGDFVENEYGPLGIFLTKDNVYLAHDAGNIYKVSRDNISSLLSKID